MGGLHGHLGVRPLIGREDVVDRALIVREGTLPELPELLDSWQSVQDHAVRPDNLRTFGEVTKKCFLVFLFHSSTLFRTSSLTAMTLLFAESVWDLHQSRAAVVDG